MIFYGVVRRLVIRNKTGEDHVAHAVYLHQKVYFVLVKSL